MWPCRSRLGGEAPRRVLDMTVAEVRGPWFPLGAAGRPGEVPRAPLAPLERQSARIFRGCARGVICALISGVAGLGVLGTALLLTA